MAVAKLLRRGTKTPMFPPSRFKFLAATEHQSARPIFLWTGTACLVRQGLDTVRAHIHRRLASFAIRYVHAHPALMVEVADFAALAASLEASGNEHALTPSQAIHE